MSRKNRTHLRGERGQAFANLMRGKYPEQILCVSLDIHKYFHRVIIHNALGEIMTPAFEIDIFQTGFERLCQATDEASTRTNAQVVLLGMEPSGHYYENLACHLHKRPRSVTLINSYSVKENRKQKMMRHEKDDDIDVAAIGDLLWRGEGTPFQPISGVYLQLRHLDRERIGKIKMRTMLQNQIIGHLDRIFPGLIIIGPEARARYEPLFAVDFWSCKTLQHLIRVCPDPRRLVAMSPQDLIDAFHAQKYTLSRRYAAKIIAYTKKVLLPDADLIAIRCELLPHDLALLEEVERHIAQLEERLVDLVAQTPYQILTQLKGLSILQVVSLAAAIGDPTCYTHAGQIFRRSGMVPGRNDSGNHQRKGRGCKIVKVGDVYLRRALMNALSTLILHQPVLLQYYNELKKSKPAGVARVATARRLVGLLWAALRDRYSATLITKEGDAM